MKSSTLTEVSPMCPGLNGSQPYSFGNKKKIITSVKSHTCAAVTGEISSWINTAGALAVKLFV